MKKVMMERIMSIRRLSFVLTIFLLLTSQFSVFATFADISEDEAVSTLSSAEEIVGSAYQLVSEAEQAGANVSSLLSRLNEAAVFLSDARIAFRVGDFQETTRFANLSKDIGEDVKTEAFRLKNLAARETVQRVWLTMMGSVLGVVLTVLGSFVGWGILKRRYFRHVLKMRPEVGSDES